MTCFLGIDNGGTTTKAAVFDESGRQLSVASESTQVLCPRAGYAERDMEDLWAMNRRVIRRALEQGSIRPQDLAGVACCGHGKGLYLLDRAGQPLRRGILSADNRALRCVKAWKADGTEAAAFQLSLQHIMACQPVALLAWLRDNEPETAAKIGWVLPCKDYVRYRLTGIPLAEVSDMSGTGLMNLRTRDYDPALLDLFGLRFVKDALPPLCGSLEPCGQVTAQAGAETGLLPGTPVYGGMFDIDACALAVGAVTPRELCMITGTWSINEFVSPVPVLSGQVEMNSLFCLGGQYLIEESSATSAGNNEWFLKKILGQSGEDIYARANAMAESLDPTEPLPLFLPFVMAGNANPDALGAFVGLTQAHTQKHLIRSVYEGVAFSHRWHYERLLPSRTEPVTEISMAGGAARSQVWTGMFADILGRPIRVSPVQETGALGCAIAAAAASGCKASLDQALGDMARLSDPVLPNPELSAHYNARYALYLETMQALDGVWRGYRAQYES